MIMAFCCCPKCSVLIYTGKKKFIFFPTWFLSALVFCSPLKKTSWLLKPIIFHYYFSMRHNTNTHTPRFSPGGPDSLWSWARVSGVIFNQPFLEPLLNQLKVMPRSGGRVWTGAFKGKATVRHSLLHIQVQTGCRSQTQYAHLNTEHDVAFSESKGS